MSINKGTFITETAYGESQYSRNYWKNHRNKLDDLFIFAGKQCFGSGRYRVESYGYYAKPTDLANIPYDKVFMCCIKFEKNSKSPGIFIDIVE